ncbi:outer membrane lipoprotein LolB [Methylomagnum ishizawai]|uniref:Outer-membrane lipoprotein LolB n=1 Tax=Methylomagnum ishizawai TaxID=1760988 RepID=A0A1Y6D255_9GAMM|nr:lipoprotein insertase outer membrane protein LolB [Methylomagnum ishizawai]SMF94075.1 outer membrane lipoprotein LolB [Methylomagnum ishizawai]
MPSNKRWGAALLLAALMVLPGCAWFRGTGTPAPAVEADRAALYALKAWRMDGRIGIQTAHDAWQANLFWEHEPAQDRLRISGPLSQGMISIVLQKDLIYINEGNGVTQLSRDPDAALRERLGFAVPLSSLRSWILGIPDPGLESTPLPAEAGAVGGFRQSGWTIHLDQYMEANGHPLPRKFRIQGSGVKLKIVADTWEIKG